MTILAAPNQMKFLTEDCPSGHKYRSKFGLCKWKRKYKKLLKDYELMSKKPFYYYSVKVERRVDLKSKLYDYDNFVFGVKPVIDILVDKSLLLGDDLERVHVKYDQAVTVSDAGSYLIVTLFDLKLSSDGKRWDDAA